MTEVENVLHIAISMTMAKAGRTRLAIAALLVFKVMSGGELPRTETR
jgi:hypothetical protein